MNKLVFLSLSIPIFLLLVPNVYTNNDSEFTGDNFKARQDDRPAINPDFDPDESCLFDTYQARCIPGSDQECPEGLGGSNDDQTCVPEHDRCPEGYHSTQDDETGQCHPNDDEGEGVGGCEYEGMILTQSENTGGDICIDYKIDCNLNEDHVLCNGVERTDGLQICYEPDHPAYKFCNDA